MRKLAVLLFSAVALTVSSGCVAVVKNKGPLGSTCSRQAVTLDGVVYIVDVHTGEVCKVDGQAVKDAKGFTPCTRDHAEVIIVDD